MRPTFVIYHNITTYYNISIFLTVPGKVDGADPVRFLYQQFCCKRDGREASVGAKAVEDDHGAFDTLGRMPGPQRKLKSAALHNAALRRCRRQFPAHCCTRCRACTRLFFDILYSLVHCGPTMDSGSHPLLFGRNFSNSLELLFILRRFGCNKLLPLEVGGFYRARKGIYTPLNEPMNISPRTSRIHVDLASCRKEKEVFFKI